MFNTFGTLFRITTFGESHGAGIGVVIDGCPAGLYIDTDFLQAELNRRRPAQSALVSQRKESDRFQILAGIYEGKSTGAPLAFFIANENARPQDYEHLQAAFRPSHADFTYHHKYGIRDPRGGGRSSARETAARVLGGAVAKLLLKNAGVEIAAWVAQVGALHYNLNDDLCLPQSASVWRDAQGRWKMEAFRVAIASNAVRCPDAEQAAAMEALIREVRKAGDTVGGVVQCLAANVPAGWGEPMYDKLQARLAAAMLGIHAVKGFDYGSGFAGAAMRGSQHNDIFEMKEGRVTTHSNFSGGVQGGISNGAELHFRVAFKPVATLMRPQPTVNAAGEAIILEGKGRHDPCVLPRAVPVVEAMTALVLADFYLLAKRQ